MSPLREEFESRRGLYEHFTSQELKRRFNNEENDIDYCAMVSVLMNDRHDSSVEYDHSRFQRTMDLIIEEEMDDEFYGDEDEDEIEMLEEEKMMRMPLRYLASEAIRNLSNSKLYWFITGLIDGAALTMALRYFGVL